MQEPKLTCFIPPLCILRELLSSLKQVHELLYALRFSTMLCHTEGVVSSLAKYGISELATGGRDSNEVTCAEREIIREALSVLHSEEKNGYSFLFQQATINTYTYLEAAIKSLVIGNFRIQDRLSGTNLLDTITVPFTQFRSLSDEEQFEYLYLLYENKTGAVLQQGVKRFECLLEPIGFSGPRSEAVDDGIKELLLVRNQLLYKNGIVDKGFAEICPWFSSQLGRKLSITPEMFEGYHAAVIEYIAILMKRMEERTSAIKSSGAEDSDAA